MVAQNRISAVVSSTDLERSREFYEKKVGLTLSLKTVPNHPSLVTVLTPEASRRRAALATREALPVLMLIVVIHIGRAPGQLEKGD